MLFLSNCVNSLYLCTSIYVCVCVCGAVVLQEDVCGVWDSSRGRGRGVGSVVSLGGVQQDLRRRGVLFYQTL